MKNLKNILFILLAMFVISACTNTEEGTTANDDGTKPAKGQSSVKDDTEQEYNHVSGKSALVYCFIVYRKCLCKI